MTRPVYDFQLYFFMHSFTERCNSTNVRQERFVWKLKEHKNKGKGVSTLELLVRFSTIIFTLSFALWIKAKEVLRVTRAHHQVNHKEENTRVTNLSRGLWSFMYLCSLDICCLWLLQSSPFEVKKNTQLIRWCDFHFGGMSGGSLAPQILLSKAGDTLISVVS